MNIDKIFYTRVWFFYKLETPNNKTKTISKFQTPMIKTRLMGFRILNIVGKLAAQPHQIKSLRDFIRA